MAALKEIKERIRSVGSTEKITSAMRMISSAKLTKAQKLIDRMRPFEQSLSKILTNLLSGVSFDSPLSAVRPVKRIAIVVVSADTSLCGAFNTNIIKRFTEILNDYKHLGQGNIELYPSGKKIKDAIIKMGYEPMGNLDAFSQTPTYEQARRLAEDLMGSYIIRELDRVLLIYHRFRTVASAELMVEEYLPVKLDVPEEKGGMLADYIIEPDPDTVIERLLPIELSLKIYTMALDSLAAEHAARMIAMQAAGDNAQALLDELNLQYNKSRQQAITNELLDIVGGSFK